MNDVMSGAVNLILKHVCGSSQGSFAENLAFLLEALKKGELTDENTLGL